MKEFERTIKVHCYPFGVVAEKRMVNQPEIVEYFRRNPGRTERQMQLDVYGYDRHNTYWSNKKYAECLRRALRAGKLSRVRAKTEEGIRFIYFVPAYLAVNEYYVGPAQEL